MASFTRASALLAILLLITRCLVTAAVAGGNFNQDVEVTWGNERAQILAGGRQLTLSLDKASGSGFQSKHQFLFGRFDMQLKLVPGNSAGTVTTYYLSSEGPTHDEIDFEFLGNVSGQPYTVHTNVYCQGKGNREQQFHLWFDPTAAFHTYSIVWNPQRIIWMVDNIPLRVFNNNEGSGVPFPTSQPMTLYSSLWNADDWATQGGRVKTDWTNAPFTASYRNFMVNACLPSSSPSESSSCDSKFSNSSATSSSSDEPIWQTQQLDSNGRKRLRWVQHKFMIYNYCTDSKRFPGALPRECRLRPRSPPS